MQDATGGWTVFTQEGEERTWLEPTGDGSFAPLQYPAQTFYYSRQLAESLPAPMLEIQALNRSIAVFLDDELIYTDFPEMENKVGAMQLPMQPEDRTESLRISLPPDYNGKTLTIAQSTPGLENSEKPGYFEEKAFLCPVTLFCGYSYESSIVAESFQTAYPATAFAVLAGATLFLFVYQAWHEKLDPAFLCLALFLILLALQQLFSASFVNRYFPFSLKILSIFWMEASGCDTSPPFPSCGFLPYGPKVFAVFSA